jgi:hypothetical protein
VAQIDDRFCAPYVSLPRAASRSGEFQDAGADGSEGLAHARAIRTAGLRHIRATAPSFAAKGLGTDPNQINRVDPACEIGRDTDNETGTAILSDHAKSNDAGADPGFLLVDKALQIFRLDTFDRSTDERKFANFFNRLRLFAAAAQRKLAARLGQIAIELAPFFSHLVRALGNLVDAGAQHLGDLPQSPRLIIQVPPGGGAGGGFDAPDPGRNRSFAKNGDQPDIARAHHVRAPAQLD